MLRDLLVISDLHLGDDLGPKSPTVVRLELELIAFLDHHRTDGRDWQLVINGDMLDLIGVTLMPSDVAPVGPLHPYDHHYGLGGRARAAQLKLRHIVAHHREVFRALARFVGAGHGLAMVIGNHDAELHWPGVQDALVSELCALCVDEAGGDGVRVRDNTSFCPWFFLEEGVAFIEHGHQYDPYCSFENVLAPATDEYEIDVNVGVLLLRYLGSQFGDDFRGAWGRGFWGYIRFWLAQGPSRAGAIVGAYVHMCRRLVEHWRARHPARIAARLERAHRKRARLGKRVRLSEDKLHRLARLWRPPVVVDLNRLVQAVMLDRLLLLLSAPALLILLVAVLPWQWQPVALVAVVPVLGGWGWWASTAREPADPRPTIREAVGTIRSVVRVPYVVMGHTHHPVADAAAGYFNTGTWIPHGDGLSAFTHVRIERTAAGATAMLCQWRDGASRMFNPERLVSAREDGDRGGEPDRIHPRPADGIAGCAEAPATHP